MDRLSILVLAGGPSAEREVSLLGGRAVAAALTVLGHRVTLADAGPDDLSALDTPGIDVVFPVLHGIWGEDGQLQAILDGRGLFYPGSGPEASALAMDKSASKAAFQAAGLPTPAWRVLTEWADDLLDPNGRKCLKCATGGLSAGAMDNTGGQLKAASATQGPGRKSALGLPLVVKPIDQGSSVDLTIARDAEQLRAAVQAVCDGYGRCLVEQFVAGRELTVGVLDGSALPPIEIVVHGHEFYDYQAKYFDDRTEYRVDPPLPAATRAELLRLALAAHAALGCRDFSRVDFIVPESGPAVILEVNTIPGFTSHSLLPKAAAAAGVDFPALCQRLVELAMARSQARRAESA